MHKRAQLHDALLAKKSHEQAHLLIPGIGSRCASLEKGRSRVPWTLIQSYASYAVVVDRGEANHHRYSQAAV